MAQMFQIQVSTNPAGTLTDLGVTGATGVVVKNLGYLPVLLGVSTSGSDNQLINDAYFVLPPAGAAPGWRLLPGEATPVINLSAGEYLLATLPGLGDSGVSLSTVLQVYAD